MDKEYIVTLRRKEDLEQFYNEMQLTNFPLVLKRPLSRNTHYMMTEEQAERLRQDPRVLAVELKAHVENIARRAIPNREAYNIGGTFWKDGPVSSSINANNLQWGQLHCAGDVAQRRKGTWGDLSNPVTEFVTDNVVVFDRGENVDVVIVDDPVSYDSGEWVSPKTGQSRFVQYQWFNELNTLVGSIDDDNMTLPTGTITYGTNASTPQYHGIHVAGTACGRHYGWAQESNIYNLAVTDAWSSGQQVSALLIYDYLRAFHQSKPVNPLTGKKNPTITNHSYGGVRSVNESETTLTIGDISAVVYRGTNYSSVSPNPSGWTLAGLETDCGIRALDRYPSHSYAVSADVQDAIDDGVVIIGAAGNDNLLMDVENGTDWDNRIITTTMGTIYYNRGAWPCTPDTDCINVGALSDRSDFARSSYTMFGPGVTVFAPGDLILSSFGNTGGFNDTKYGAGNYFYPIPGTSMASPQVCGVIACYAATKERITQADAIAYLQKTNVEGDMTFDVGGGGFDDDTCRKNSPNAYLTAQTIRDEVGYILEQKSYRSTEGVPYNGGNSRSYLTFPRSHTFRAPYPAPLPQTYTFTVGNSGASDYTFIGSDKVNTFNGNTDPTIECNAGDTLVFNVNASGHPFWVKTSATTGQGNAVTTGTITGNGRAVGTVTWNTTGVAAGTYYYICEFHSSMLGSIVIS